MKIHNFSCSVRSRSLALVEGLGVREKSQTGAGMWEGDLLQGGAVRSGAKGISVGSG